MTIQKQDELAMTRSYADTLGVGCDESKCISKGKTNLFGGSNTCYGNSDGFVFPMLCADGFLPVVVEDEPPSLHIDWWGKLEVSYFTCCPPYSANAIDETRQCSDPISTATTDFDPEDDDMVDRICEDLDRKNPRRMKSSKAIVPGGFAMLPGDVESFVCCDSPLPSGNEYANFLEDLECVPYHSKSLQESQEAQEPNIMLHEITCDFPDGSYTVPRPLEGQNFTDVQSTGQYQCCKTGTAPEPVVQDEAFKITIYIPLATWTIAAVASALVVIALLIPLFIQSNDAASKTQSNRGMIRSIKATLRSIRSTTRSRRPKKKKPCYSTYNLYLVYLALFDLIFSLIQIGMYLGTIQQKHITDFFTPVYGSFMDLDVPILRSRDAAISFTMVNISMWINATILYELFLLLKQTKHLRRISQPSVRRINIQVGSILLLSIVYLVILYFVKYASFQAGMAGDAAKLQSIVGTLHGIFWIFLLVPIVAICGISLAIWWRGYLPPVKSQSAVLDKASRQLFVFFFRIIMIFFIIWTPAMIFLVVALRTFKTGCFLWTWSLLAVQPILSTCMVLTKFDTRKYILDLLCLSYCRDEGDKEESTNTFQTQTTDAGHPCGVEDFSNEMTRGEQECSSIGNIGRPKKSVRMNLVSITMSGQIGAPRGVLGPADDNETEANADARAASRRASDSLQFSLFGCITTDAESDDESPVDVEKDANIRKPRSSITLGLDAISGEL